MQMADPAMQGHYSSRALYQALAIAAMCVQEQPNLRPVIADVVTALTYLASQKYNPERRSSRASYMSESPRSSKGTYNSFNDDYGSEASLQL